MLVFLATLIVSDAAGQEQNPRAYKRGSYSYYGELKIEDNSFLLDEAFNQDKGVMQFISNFSWSNLNSNCMVYSFTHEIPVVNNHHQASYTLQYNFNQPFGKTHYSGPGDLILSYSYMAAGKDDRVMIIPQINLIVPTGDPAKGLGNGGFGGKLGLAITKRFSRTIVTHYNFSETMIYQADYLTTLQSESRKAEKNIKVRTYAASVIWYPTSRLNLMFESVANHLSDTNANGSPLRTWQAIGNPGVRFAVDLHKAILVSGASFPFTVGGDSLDQPGVFIYLSLEGK